MQVTLVNGQVFTLAAGQSLVATAAAGAVTASVTAVSQSMFTPLATRRTGECGLARHHRRSKWRSRRRSGRGRRDDRRGSGCGGRSCGRNHGREQQCLVANTVTKYGRRRRRRRRRRCKRRRRHRNQVRPRSRSPSIKPRRRRAKGDATACHACGSAFPRRATDTGSPLANASPVPDTRRRPTCCGRRRNFSRYALASAPPLAVAAARLCIAAAILLIVAASIAAHAQRQRARNAGFCGSRAARSRCTSPRGLHRSTTRRLRFQRCSFR